MTLRRSATGSVLIRRSPAEVYGFYRDLTHLPQFLGDVYEVRDLGGRRYRWTVKVKGPLNVSTVVQIVDEVADRRLCYRVAAPLADTEWLLTFAPEAGATRVVETLTGPFGPPVGWVMSLLGKHPAAEVPANLQRLKELLEEGRVSTTTNAIPGKFGPS